MSDRKLNEAVTAIGYALRDICRELDYIRNKNPQTIIYKKFYLRSGQLATVLSEIYQKPVMGKGYSEPRMLVSIDGRVTAVSPLALLCDEFSSLPDIPEIKATNV